ncbi:hypothetical protein [Thermococcus barophilus]|uniref:Uncharacterized protein n=1 Tax=Thermococcus barophilus (strain DSM 11836 / MP) TaxID=391623 RepID=F0LJ63_THEBM|nr:hypothetical protein [Thermococcus barophilus]ADT84585.1 hypothetical protein TERMP_01610 [Thermococcus barophilus MP]
MKVYEPLMLAMPLAKWMSEFIIENKKLPTGDDVRKFLRYNNLEEICLDEGLVLHRGKFVLTLTFPAKEHIIVDIISSSGELSDALEVIAYHDRKLEAYVIEIIPANELEFEGNIGLEPVIIDDKGFELKSYPVLGHFEEEKDGVFLVIDSETYQRWGESGKLDICPICGAEGLAWRKNEAYCNSCGFGIKVKGGRQ